MSRRIWKWWALASVAALWVGCQGCSVSEESEPEVSDPLPDFPVLETRDFLLTYGDDEGAEGDEKSAAPDLEVREQAQQVQTGPPASLRSLRAGLRSANRLTRTGILLIRGVQNNATRVEEDGERRRAWVRDLDGGHALRLSMDRAEEDSRTFRYGLFVVKAGADDGHEVLVTGRVSLAAEGGLDAGFFQFNFDALEGLEGFRNFPRGVGSVGFRQPGEERKSLSVQFDAFQSAPDADPVTELYTYRLRPEGVSLFSFVAREFDDEEFVSSTVQQTTAWTPTLSSRTLARLKGPAGEGEVQECWNENRQRVWIDWTPDRARFPDEGDRSECSLALRDLNLEIPGQGARVPVGDALIPGASEE